MRNGLLNIYRPMSYDEAIELAVTHGSGASFYSGGVHLVPTMRDGSFATETLIDVKHLPGARDVISEADEVVIGAAATYREFGYSRTIWEAFPTMADGVFSIGNPRVRAVGTIGGGLAVRASESDIALLLAAHDAQVVAQGPGGKRQYPVASWMEQPDGIELLTHVHIPKGDHHVTYHRFPRYGAPLAVSAARRTVKDSGTELDVIVGCTGTAPRRLDVTHLLAPEGSGTPPDHDSLVATVSQSIDATDAPSASADYRCHLAGVLAARAISDLQAPVGADHRGGLRAELRREKPRGPS